MSDESQQDAQNQQDHERAVVAFKRTWDILGEQGISDETARQALLSLSIVALVSNMGEHAAASVAEGLAQKIRDGAFTPQNQTPESGDQSMAEEILDRLAGGPGSDDHEDEEPL